MSQQAMQQALEVQRRAKKWIEFEMEDAGWSRERIEDPPTGSHLHALNESIAVLEKELALHTAGGTQAPADIDVRGAAFCQWLDDYKALRPYEPRIGDAFDGGFRKGWSAHKAHTAGATGSIGEPLAWLYEDTLPDSYPYDEMFPHSEVRSGVRMFPVFGPPAIEANDAKDAAWQMKAAVWLRAKASEQEATNARYPRHAEAYPSWGERAKWWRSAADELAAMSTHQPKESGNG